MQTSLTAQDKVTTDSLANWKQKEQWFLYITLPLIVWVMQNQQEVDEQVQRVGITASKVPGEAQDNAEQLGVELANLLLQKGAKEILTVARQLNDAR